MSNQLTSVNFLVPIQNPLILVEELIRAQAEGHHYELNAAINHLVASGGKRIRPAVALLTGTMLGADTDRLVTLAAAIELLHTATLVHDDLIDGALMRRGISTLNAQWSPAATILTGDFIFAKAAKLAADTNSVEVMKVFADTLATIVNGEITQMFTSHGLPSQENYDCRIYAKTASMFELATSAAALLSPVGQGVVEEMRKLGYHLGMAFQIIDDILDFTSDKVTLGKPVASDLKQGIITLPALLFYNSHKNDTIMNALLVGNSIPASQMDILIEAIKESGSIEQSLLTAYQHIETSLNILGTLEDCPERRSLEDLSWYIVRRNT